MSQVIIRMAAISEKLKNNQDLRKLNKIKMGGSCENCCHRCCINGESGILVVRECEECGKDMYLCSNDLTEEELEERCNGEACGCGDNDEVICDDCRK